MRMVNTAKVAIKLNSLGGVVVPPGGLVDIPDGYCVPRPSTTGATKTEPAIRLMAPQLMPADASLHERYLANDLDVQPPAPQAPSAQQLEAAGMSPGVAALVAAGEAASVQTTSRTASQKGTSKPEV